MAQDKQRAGKRGEERASELAPRPKDEKLAAEIDSVLDEIDDVLEEDAEAFVAGYIQKGGE